MFSKCLRATKLRWIITRLWLWGVALRVGADIYHCNDLDTLDIGVMMKLMGKRLVYDSHELYVEEIPPGPAKVISAARESLYVKLADVIITVNAFIADELRKRYHINRRIHVVLNCPNALGRMASELRFRNRSGIITVLYHGGFYHDRGLENLVLASKYFDEGIRLVMRGHGGLENKLRALGSGRSNVVFEESVPMNQVVEAAASADIGIIPHPPTNLSTFYCSPNRLFEYIQAGLAVVASDLPFLREIVLGNQIGMVFNPHDPRDLARKINLAAKGSNLSVFRQNVRKIADRYSWEVERHELYSAYADLEKTSPQTGLNGGDDASVSDDHKRDELVQSGSSNAQVWFWSGARHRETVPVTTDMSSGRICPVSCGRSPAVHDEPAGRHTAHSIE
jgi:glycosyltransferase involved in cell wall biosynthesis